MDVSPIIMAHGLKKHFKIGRQVLKAVDGLDIAISRGQTLGLVGESGCGKSTAGRTLLGLHAPTEGRVLFNGRDIRSYSKKELKTVRRKMQLIPQDPYSSLDPRMKILDIIAEPLDIHNLATGKQRKNQVCELMELVGLDVRYMNCFPHELSGGQRQRVAIARALALQPEFIVCDEPVSALDVSVQAQVVSLLKELQSSLGMAYLFISHDLSMVRYISNHILVIYLGKMVEYAPGQTLYKEYYHPYTEALLSAAPIPDPHIERKRERIFLAGEVPSPINPPPGCVFHTRCPKAMDICSREVPPWKQIKPGHFTACHLYSFSSP